MVSKINILFKSRDKSLSLTNVIPIFKGDSLSAIMHIYIPKIYNVTYDLSDWELTMVYANSTGATDTVFIGTPTSEYLDGLYLKYDIPNEQDGQLKYTSANGATYVQLLLTKVNDDGTTLVLLSDIVSIPISSRDVFYTDVDSSSMEQLQISLASINARINANVTNILNVETNGTYIEV